MPSERYLPTRMAGTALGTAIKEAECNAAIRAAKTAS